MMGFTGCIVSEEIEDVARVRDTFLRPDGLVVFAGGKGLALLGFDERGNPGDAETIDLGILSRKIIPSNQGGYWVAGHQRSASEDRTPLRGSLIRTDIAFSRLNGNFEPVLFGYLPTENLDFAGDICETSDGVLLVPHMQIYEYAIELDDGATNYEQVDQPTVVDVIREDGNGGWVNSSVELAQGEPVEVDLFAAPDGGAWAIGSYPAACLLCGVYEALYFGVFDASGRLADEFRVESELPIRGVTPILDGDGNLVLSVTREVDDSTLETTISFYDASLEVVRTISLDYDAGVHVSAVSRSGALVALRTTPDTNLQTLAEFDSSGALLWERDMGAAFWGINIPVDDESRIQLWSPYFYHVVELANGEWLVTGDMGWDKYARDEFHTSRQYFTRMCYMVVEEQPRAGLVQVLGEELAERYTQTFYYREYFAALWAALLAGDLS